MNRARILVAFLLAIVSCSSPNRGWWRGSFEGDVAGIMEFSINSRGTRATGKVSGALSSGESFRAEFEGTLSQGYLHADLVGSSDTDIGLRAGFLGLIAGHLEGGEAAGSWQADLRQAGRHLEGLWQASQNVQRQE